jgi:hypothetical protein
LRLRVPTRIQREQSVTTASAVRTSSRDGLCRAARRRWTRDTAKRCLPGWTGIVALIGALALIMLLTVIAGTGSLAVVSYRRSHHVVTPGHPVAS